eukprot:TRINITY_DN6070_c0_g1_i8.p1 TRINITY_DN6070_c0_g1~~TRINITY_DN6070_c0_g1_i8.p1  ORF type:complete len:795 (+),score=117.70 TRINITY_DN6070_c0_g1_i8:169-2385(+)
MKALREVKVDRSYDAHNTDQVLRKAVEKYHKQKELLIGLIHSVRRFFGRLPTKYLPFCLAREELQVQISDMLEGVESNLCPILILGDVSAGKSLFINLLLQMKLLPTTSRHCTPTICEIEYSKSHSITLFPHAQRDVPLNKIELLDKSPKDCHAELSLHLNKAKIIGTTKTSPYSRVVLRWDAPILKHGVVLVDSPGLNDGEHNLDEVVRRYTPKAIAIICIISCENGVTESARNLIESAMEQENFNPAALMFVCTKSDRIPEREKKAVLSDIHQALRNIIGCEPAVLALNVRGALKMLTKYKFQTPDLRTFNSALDRFLAESFRFKLQRYSEKLWSFNNQFGLVSRAELEIHGRLALATHSEAENKQLYRTVKSALKRFKQSKRANFAELERLATTLQEDLVSMAKRCISKNEDQLRIYAASLIVPPVEDYNQLETFMKEKLIAQVEALLRGELQSLFNERREPLLLKMHEIWQGLNNDLQDTEQLLFNMQANIAKNDQWVFVSKLFFGANAPLWLPLNIIVSAAMVINTGPLLGIGLGGLWLYEKIEQQLQFNQWKKEPAKWQKDFVRGFKARLMEQHSVVALVSRYIDPKRFVSNLSQYFDKIVADNKRYLTTLIEERRPNSEVLAECSSLYEQLSPLCLSLILFHINHLVRNPVNYCDLHFINADEMGRYMMGKQYTGNSFDPITAHLVKQSGEEPGFLYKSSYGRIYVAEYKGKVTYTHLSVCPFAIHLSFFI